MFIIFHDPLLFYQVDLVEQMGPLPFNLDFFTECQDMRQLLAYLDAPPDVGDEEDGPERGRAESGEGEDDKGEGMSKSAGGKSGSQRQRGNERFFKMTEEICDVVDSYGLVCFYPLNIQVWYLLAMSPYILHGTLSKTVTVSPAVWLVLRRLLGVVAATWRSEVVTTQAQPTISVPPNIQSYLVTLVWQNSQTNPSWILKRAALTVTLGLLLNYNSFVLPLPTSTMYSISFSVDRHMT